MIDEWPMNVCNVFALTPAAIISVANVWAALVKRHRVEALFVPRALRPLAHGRPAEGRVTIMAEDALRVRVAQTVADEVVAQHRSDRDEPATGGGLGLDESLLLIPRPLDADQAARQVDVGPGERLGFAAARGASRPPGSQNSWTVTAFIRAPQALTRWARPAPARPDRTRERRPRGHPPPRPRGSGGTARHTRCDPHQLGHRRRGNLHSSWVVGSRVRHREPGNRGIGRRQIREGETYEPG